MPWSQARALQHLFLSNYASLNIVDELKRVPGVGDVTIFGAGARSMRIWLKPAAAQLGITTAEIAAAIRAQNAQSLAGKIGGEPAPDDQMLVYTVTAKGRLLSEDEFANIVIRASSGRSVAAQGCRASNWVLTATISKSRSTASRPSAWGFSANRGQRP